MANKAKSKVEIDISKGPQPLYDYLKRYQAHLYKDSSSEKGHVYWSAPVSMWILVMRKGNKAIVTFHAANDCPCKMI
jgi:hypothetical protein